MARNLVNGTNIVIEESGDNISMDLSSTYSNTLQQNINNSFKENNIYSTTETVVGTWINGNPIYRKVVQINSLPNNTETTYQTGIINGETIKYDGFLSLSESDLGLQHMPYLSPYSATGNIYYWVKKDATYIHIKTSTDRSSSSAYIIIEYTKTTD